MVCEKDLEVLEVICRNSGWWLVFSHQLHIAKLARVARERPVEAVLAEFAAGKPLTGFDRVLESSQGK